MNILINKKEVIFGKDDFPMLISGADKTGTSFFSICLLANLLKSALKVLLFSAYPAAKEEFRKHIDKEDGAVIIESGGEDAFLEKIKSLNDLTDRVILIKNIENYSQKIFEAVKDLKLVIFSGDLNKCHFADELIKKDFTTKIFFSESSKYPNEGLASLPKYCGRIFSDKYEGIINLDIL
jgi:hypothetical protein